MKMEWAIMSCENCQNHFAICEEPSFQMCPYCGSDDTTGTGEYLSSSLYTENGVKIQ